LRVSSTCSRSTEGHVHSRTHLQQKYRKATETRAWHIDQVESSLPKEGIQDRAPEKLSVIDNEGSRSAEGRAQGQQEDDDGHAGTTLSAHVAREPERRHFGANDAHPHVD